MSTNLTSIFVTLNNASINITPGKTSVEEVIGTLCADFSESIIMFAALLCILVTVKDVMQAIQKRKIKKQPDWNAQHPNFVKVLYVIDEVTGTLTFIFCAYIIFVTLIPYA